MKTVWVCRWEFVPGNGEQQQTYATLADALLDMRQMICRMVDLKEYLPDLEPAAASFLGRYLSEPDFPRNCQDVPASYEEPEYGDLFLDPGTIHWNYPCDAWPHLRTNLVLDPTENEDYYFDFWYEHPELAPEAPATGLNIRIFSRTEYGTGAYPLLILKVLEETPKTREEIIRAVHTRFDTRIDRRAASRNLKLLETLGFCVSCEKDGFRLSPKKP